jgi:hypothetical protein
VHVGGFEPGSHSDDARWYDLGPLDVHALLAQGALRMRDLMARMQKARVSAPSHSTVAPRITTCLWISTFSRHSVTLVWICRRSP